MATRVKSRETKLPKLSFALLYYQLRAQLKAQPNLAPTHAISCYCSLCTQTAACLS